MDTTLSDGQNLIMDIDAQVEYYMAFRFDDSQTDEQLRQNTIDYLNENGMSVDDLYKTAAANIWRDNLRDYITADARAMKMIYEQT